LSAKVLLFYETVVTQFTANDTQFAENTYNLFAAHATLAGR
jgi:hypothetical protein